MLSESHFKLIEKNLSSITDQELLPIVNNIRSELNPHPSGQIKNVPNDNGTLLQGIQHKYRETLLFFPRHGQTCHAYCTFCFRWPQFLSMDELKFASNETTSLIEYTKKHPEITDILFTGGDPMIMSANKLAAYIDPLINNEIPNLQTIRIGSKSLSYWPYRFLSDKDADSILRLFEKVVNKGYHLAFMAHFNHPRELKTKAVEKAIKRIQNTGAIIRTQSPIMNHINNDALVWKEMWNKQVQLGLVPYYMFVARNTGAQKYFSVSLENTWKIFNSAYQEISGIARTVRGPIMSANPGKIQILGVQKINGQKVFVLRFLNARDPMNVGKLFLAKYDPNAIWWNELEQL